MVKYFCFECKNGKGECNAPCEYIDPIGEMQNADHIRCEINDAIWVRRKCKCCGNVI